jgi:predicted nucleic acid-binding Zn ribbon protein
MTNSKFCAYCGTTIPADQTEDSVCSMECLRRTRSFCQSVAQRAYRATRLDRNAQKGRATVSGAVQLRKRQAIEDCLWTAVGSNPVTSPGQCLNEVGLVLAKSYLWQLVLSAKLCDVKRLWGQFKASRERP